MLIFSQIQTILLSFVFGACIGSFLNVLIWRLPREKTIRGRSECVACGKHLTWHELVPILSFAVQRGKCRGCGIHISFSYPVIEFTTAILFAVSAFYFTPQDLLSSVIFLKVLYVLAIAVLVFVIDLEHYLILDRIIAPAAVFILLLNLITAWLSGDWSLVGEFYGGLLAGVVAMIPLWILWKVSGGRWIGLGDVKFIGLMGLVLGPINTLVAFFVAVAVGTLVSIILMLARKKQLTSQVPFGTFLAAGLVVALWWGEVIARTYWSFVWPS